MVETKAKERNLSFERSKLLEIDRVREIDEAKQLKEADTVIGDMTDLLRKRESEIKILIEENKQLMLRYVKLESLVIHVSNFKLQSIVIEDEKDNIFDFLIFEFSNLANRFRSETKNH